MKRPKVHAVTAKNYLAMSEAAWAIALRLGEFGYSEIAVGLKVSHEQATRFVRGWLKEGAVEQLSEGRGNNRCRFRAYADFVRPEPLRQRTPAENMWTAMRRLRSFTPSDLSAHATTETVSVDQTHAGAYCRSLLSAGYLSVVRPASPSVNREAIYRLVNETGPQAPVTKRVAALVDPNSGETIVLGGNL
ncbi:hypothetical protein EGN72_02600 [Pseudorhodobacter sp. E13]|uniref:hypothetical protein n=1 Tax=Pseudorhodobacter sp. E13 TaxID=2487931 RepID=UPI000F8EB8E2|nr:hypothetical protein [Pseudorhodobacter sp. E13]RUS64901.1 hypothetical protein EGN72_02600 [Pseudorhodobacter sp. E13]